MKVLNNEVHKRTHKTIEDVQNTIDQALALKGLARCNICKGLGCDHCHNVGLVPLSTLYKIEDSPEA